MKQLTIFNIVNEQMYNFFNGSVEEYISGNLETLWRGFEI